MQILKIDTLGRGWSTELGQALLTAGQVLVSRRGDNPRIVVGAPHHAQTDQTHICQPRRVADNNAGRLAACLAQELGATLVVACGAIGPDPNKIEAAQGPYQRAIFELDPLLFIEIHGMGATNARFEIEIARGTNTTSDCAGLKEALSRSIQDLRCDRDPRDAIESSAHRRLQQARVGCQDIDAIRFPGRRNHVLTRCGQVGCPAYQIETTPGFRLGRTNPDHLPRLGQRFALALALALRRYHKLLI